MSRPCTKCQRPNNDRAARCMYCGAPFPELTALKTAARKTSTQEPASEPSPEPKRRPLDSYEVVVSPLQDSSEQAVREFAREFDTDDYTARHRLRRPAPWVARTFSEPGEAQALIKSLASVGLDSYVVKHSGVEKLMAAVEVSGLSSLDDSVLVFLDAHGREVSVRLSELVLIVRGRIKVRPERESSPDEERPSVNLGRMAFGDVDDDDENEDEKSPLRAAIERIEIRPRVGRMRWVLRNQAESEVMDLYHKKSHQPVRILESEFDYTGLGDRMQPSGLRNFNFVANHVKDHSGGCALDTTFNALGYSLAEVPQEDKVKAELQSALGASESEKKLTDNTAAFSEHSARMYLHTLRRQKQPDSAPVSSAPPPVSAIKFTESYQELGPWMTLACTILIFLLPVSSMISVMSTIFEVMAKFAYFKLFPAVLGGAALLSALDLGVAVFSVYAGVGLLYLRPKAVVVAKVFLLVFGIYVVAAALIPWYSDLGAAARQTASIEAGLKPLASNAMSSWGFPRLLAGLAFLGSTLTYLNMSEHVKKLFPD